MRIKILGVGGAINDGIPYNAFVIDRRLLCEAPPDIMVSLKKQGVDYTKIRTVYISHFHADHCYGMPFLLLNQFYVMEKRVFKEKLIVAGPGGIKNTILSLLARAFGAGHPCVAWTKRTYRFCALEASSRFVLLAGYQTKYFRMHHPVETYGFIVSKHAESFFAYTSDTLWCRSVENMLAYRPRVILIDLNGKNSDRVKVHASRADVLASGLPITGNSTEYYGTHLRHQESSSSRHLTYAKAGMTINIT